MYHHIQVYKANQPRLVRCSDYHPTHQPEGFFYNYLLLKISFRAESELLSNANPDSSYLTECMLKGYINTEEVRRNKREQKLRLEQRSCH